MDTKQEIMNYIEMNENNGALLITGKWGCGKTFFINQIAKELNGGTDYCVAVISLFDVDSIDLLHRRIKEEYFQLSMSKAGKLVKKGSAFFDILRKVADAINSKFKNENVGIITKGTNVILAIDPSNYIAVNNKIEEKKFILVLDDFERCKIDKDKLLGGINGYVEKLNIKTIIIADEEKIKEEGDKNEVKKYTEFKEKVIGRTIKFSYDHEIIIRNMISNYKSTTEYKRFLSDNIQIIHSAFNDSKCENLRTVKSVICDFERVYDTWTKYGDFLDYRWSMLYQFFALTAEYKAGNYYKNTHYNIYMLNGKINAANATYEETTDERERIKKKYKKDTFSNPFDSFSRWIVDGEWNEEDFLLELRRRYETTEIRPEDRFLLCNFWSLNNESIIRGIPIATQKAYDGELSCDELVSFLQKIHFIREIDQSLVVDIDYKKIEDGLQLMFKKIRSGSLSEISLRKHTYYSEIDENAISIYKKIENLTAKIVGWNGYKAFLSVLKENDFRYEKLSKCNCIDVFDDKLYNAFIECFSKLDNDYKMDIKAILLKINWNNESYSSSEEINQSISNFRKLIDYLKNKIQSEDDIITKYIYKNFIEELEKMISENISTA